MLKPKKKARAGTPARALETGELLQVKEEADWDDDQPKEEEEEWEEEEEEEEEEEDRSLAKGSTDDTSKSLAKGSKAVKKEKSLGKGSRSLARGSTDDTSLAEGSPQRQFVGVMVDWRKTGSTMHSMP